MRKVPPPGSDPPPGDPFRMRAALPSLLLAGALRLGWFTWRRRTEGMERLDALIASGRRPLVAFWHGRYPAIFPFFRGRRACIFASRSFRGAVIAGICRRFGYEAVLIPEGAGQAALGLMRGELRRHSLGALAVDGPRGPRHIVKAGAIRLASDLGFVLLPVSVAARRRRVLAGRWDRMEIPRFFTRVALVVGEPLEVPPGVAEEEIPPWARRLTEALDAADRRAEELAAPARAHRKTRGREV